MEKKNNNIVFKTTSALDNIVTMTQETFDEHIVKHHPEMSGHEEDIRETIEKPNLIYKAKRFPEKRKQFVRKTHRNEISEYNNVIVEYDSEEKGYVKTSYYSEDIERGGDCVYFKYENKI